MFCLSLVSIKSNGKNVFIYIALRAYYPHVMTTALAGLTHQCLYFEQPHTFEQILFIQTAEPALVGHAQIT